MFVVPAERSEGRDPYSAVYRWYTAYGSPPARGRQPSLLPPHLVRQLDHHPELGPLLVRGQHVAFLGRGKAALRRQAKLFERDVFGRFLDAPLDVVARLQPPRLGGDQPEHHQLVALGQKPQRLEAAGTVAVVFQEVAVVVALREQT